MPTSAEEKRQKHYTRKKTLVGAISQKVKGSGRAVFARVLTSIRRGNETVLIPPPFARGGNWLFEWMAARAQAQSSGLPTRLQQSAGMESWLAEFPRLRELTIAKKNIKFSFMRKIAFHQDLAKHFSAHDFSDFIEQYLLTSESFSQRLQEARQVVTTESIVVNIRRGDYYSNPVIHHDFGIDTVSYVAKAIRQATDIEQADTIIVTSDDIGWCKENLTFLEAYGKVMFDKDNPGAFTDLAFVAVGHRLILTNTTFGYWGGYIASFTHGAQVWVPNIHERANLLGNSQRPMQHLDNWNVVTPPPGVETWLESAGD